MITELVQRLSYLFRRGRFDAGLDDELQFHLESRADELQAGGLSRAAALAQARREFGSTAHISEESRSAWQFTWLEDLSSDLRYAARAFRRNPAFALTAIACLALGIGANTTIFSIATEALFSRPSVSSPETLRYIRIGGMSHAPLSKYRFLRDLHAFDGLAGENSETETNWRVGESTQRIFAARVTDNYFEVMGTPVAMGRAILSGDTDTAVLSRRFWERRLNGDPAVLGRKLILDGRPYTVIGVLPQAHRTMRGMGLSPDLYLPAEGDDLRVSLYVRVPAGMQKPLILARVKAAAAELDRVYPEGRHQWADNVRVDEVYGLGRLSGQPGFLPIAAFFGMLMLVVTLVLLIACANVASLLLARASSRSQELAIRLSIGASRGRVVRQLLAESLLLGIGGAVAGLVLNFGLLALLARVVLPLPFPIVFQVQPDWRLLAYAAAVAVVSSVAAGLIPALRATRSTIAATLKRRERQVGGAWNLRNSLVAGQLAVSIVLLCAGFIFLRNLMEAANMNPGFEIDRTAWAAMRLVPEAYAKPNRTLLLVDEALERLRAIPGIAAAAVMRKVPLNDGITFGSRITTDVSPTAAVVQWSYNEVSPGYFNTMRIPIVQGREFVAADRTAAEDPAIINETMARRLFGAASPVGHTIRNEVDLHYRIVGVARNSKYDRLGEESQMALYAPYGRTGGWLPPGTDPNFMVRTVGAPERILTAMRSTLDGLDPSAAIEVRPMRKAMAFALIPSQAGALILGSVGVLGLVLASVGLYGVLLYTVSRRIREIGLRVALGATPRVILRLVLRQSVGLVAVGIAAGIALSAFAVPPLAMFLIPGVRPADPLNFVVVGAVLCAVALIATVSPAVRALRVDPVVALRHE
jgi:predicted permease